MAAKVNIYVHYKKRIHSGFEVKGVMFKVLRFDQRLRSAAATLNPNP
jgi:hypothetical protein